MATKTAPVLAISIENQSWFDEMYAPLLTGIKSKTEFQQTEDATSAVRLLSQRPLPSAVLITDQALTLPENAAVWAAVLNFVRGGGTAVVMGFFSSFVLPDDIKPFFAHAGLPWARGSYHRTTLTVNQAAAAAAGVKTQKLPQSYSQKALFVSNVAAQDMLYRTDDDSVVESRVFAATSADATGETAVALAKVGSGKIGYVGDVNAEDGSHAVVLAMCGLL
ncbi:hypothetical protein MY11210_009432 [Beauveria gryllotalpidicola]